MHVRVEFNSDLWRSTEFQFSIVQSQMPVAVVLQAHLDGVLELSGSEVKFLPQATI